MKKTVLATFILSGFSIVSSATYAQDALYIYGIMDTGIVSDHGSSANCSILQLQSGLQSQSRLGFKGKEDLGGGMSADFDLESAINVNNGALAFPGLLFGSQVWSGLTGSLGSVKFGRMFTPYFGAIATTDPFDATGPGDATRLYGASGYRMNNTVKYTLPDQGGWYGDFAYGFGGVAGDTVANRELSFDFGYLKGPLDIKVASHRADNATASNAVRNTMVGGTYDLANVKIWMSYAADKDDISLDTRQMLVGVTMPVGPHVFAADYIRKTDKFNTNANANQTVFAYYYYLSKRTNTYTIYSRLANDSAASYSVAIPGTTDNIFAVGIRHKF
jgi:predicted porin